jgi:HEAT repeat protein
MKGKPYGGDSAVSRRTMTVPLSEASPRRSLGAAWGVLVLALAVFAGLVQAADGDAARKAKVAELIRNLGDADAEIRYQATRSLGDLGPEAKDAVPALIKTLGDPDADVRYRTAVALGHIGPAAKEAVPALVNALGDPDIGVRQGAALALSEIGPGAKG